MKFKKFVGLKNSVGGDDPVTELNNNILNQYLKFSKKVVELVIEEIAEITGENISRDVIEPLVTFDRELIKFFKKYSERVFIKTIDEFNRKQISVISYVKDEEIDELDKMIHNIAAKVVKQLNL